MTDEELAILKEYAKRLDNLARYKSKQTYTNKDHKHAAIALSTILRHSEEEIVIFDDNLNGDIVNHEEVLSFKKSLIEFLSKGGRLRMAISDKCKNDDESFILFLEALEKVFFQNVEIKLANVQFKAEMKKIYGEKINAAIGDGFMYRLELYGEEKPENKNRNAIISFNDEEVSQKLLFIFNNNFNNCDKYFQN